MKSKDVTKVLRFFNEPVKHGELWIIKPRYSRFNEIVCETFGDCYKQALEEVNKLYI